MLWGTPNNATDRGGGDCDCSHLANFDLPYEWKTSVTDIRIHIIEVNDPSWP